MKAILAVALLAVCATAQTFESLPIKNAQVMTNPLWTTDLSGLKVNNGEWTNILTIQELIQHPLFQVYYQIPVFKQHLTHPLFQNWLVTPQFQNYWTHPLFPTFFQNQVLFYKYIYPQVFQTTVQTPFLFNKMNTPFVQNNYDELIKKFLGGQIVQKDLNIQGLYWDKIMKQMLVNVNKPEEIADIKTEVKVPISVGQTVVTPFEKILNEKMIEESPVEILTKDDFFKDTIVKDDLIKNILLKKIYSEKMNKMNLNKMTPEELLFLQNKMQEFVIPSRIRRNSNYVQIPNTFYTNTLNKNVNTIPFLYNYNQVPTTTQDVYYTQPQTTFNTVANTPYNFNTGANTPYKFNTVANTPYNFNTVANTPYNWNTVATPYYTNTVGVNTPYTYNTQTVV